MLKRALGLTLLIGLLGFLIPARGITAEGKPGVSAPGLKLAERGKTGYTIVHAVDCTPAELHAAEELADYLQQMTGAAFPVVDETKAPRRRRMIVGPCILSRRLLGKESVERLGGEEFVIRTNGSDLLLVGGRPRGTLYAVYHFLDNVLGVRWWARDAVSVPRKPELKTEALLIAQRPVFELRQFWLHCAWDQDWSARNRINRLYYATWIPDVPSSTACFTLDERHGGGIYYPMPGQKDCHTFYAYLPVDKYFDAHPEWFAEINGKRTRDGQPCLTNPEVLAAVTKAVLEDLRQNPKTNMVSVTQYDGDQNQCRCVNCRKIDEEEGSPSGSLLRFVNAVAEQVEKERPDVLVHTFAYTYTLTPPKLTRPRANVVIQFCIYGGANRFVPLDAPDNANWLKMLKEWHAIAPHLHVWDYMMESLHPYPNLRAMGPDLRVLADNGVRGDFMEGGDIPSGQFDELRAWVLSRLMWNPYQDDQALIAEFVNGYYGPAGRYVLEYIKLVHDAAAKGKCVLYLGGEMEPSPFVTREVMSKAEALFRQAEEAVAGEAALLDRVRCAHMSVQYLWAVNREVWAEEAKQKGLPAPPPAGGFYEALRKQALIEEDRAASVPIDLSAAAAGGSAREAQVLVDQKGSGTRTRVRMDTFLAATKREMDQSALKLSVKASGSYASQPYQAFDGDPNTAWQPGGTGGWIQKDLGRTAKVKAIRTDFGSFYTTVTYQIEGSLDGKTWMPMVPRKTGAGNRFEDRPPGSADVRFVRTTIFSAQSAAHAQGEWVGIMEQTTECD